MAFPVIAQKYPRFAGPLFQAYNDLEHAQKWDSLEVLDLEDCSRGAIKGKRLGTETISHLVVPCSIHETISLSWLQTVFSSLSYPSEVYLAITSEDSSVVYYKISSGIVKPPI